MFNIGMLKRVFNPTFELHDIKQTGEYEATTRWFAAAQWPSDYYMTGSSDITLALTSL